MATILKKGNLRALRRGKSNPFAPFKVALAGYSVASGARLVSHGSGELLSLLLGGFLVETVADGSPAFVIVPIPIEAGTPVIEADLKAA
jgi:hypothetical protein